MTAKASRWVELYIETSYNSVYCLLIVEGEIMAEDLGILLSWWQGTYAAVRCCVPCSVVSNVKADIATHCTKEKRRCCALGLRFSEEKGQDHSWSGNGWEGRGVGFDCLLVFKQVLCRPRWPQTGRESLEWRDHRSSPSRLAWLQLLLLYLMGQDLDEGSNRGQASCSLYFSHWHSRKENPGFLISLPKCVTEEEEKGAAQELSGVSSHDAMDCE